MKSLFKICVNCVMDERNDPDISFDEKGVCSYCHQFNLSDNKQKLTDENKEKKLKQIIENIKKSKRAKYDSVLGISGGADSTYLAHKAAEFGLNPLIVHYDNGWNSELAVKNIESVIKAIGLDFYSYINDWEEIKSLQKSFIKASVVDIELITDQAIVALLYKMAMKYKVKYVITGHNFSTEAILPTHWYHWKIDVGNISGINRNFYNYRLKTFPMMGFFERFYLDKFSKIKQVSLLNLMDYNKNNAKLLLAEKYGWRDYGGKHYESIFTRFYQGYILPVKFGIDKRKAHLSTLICSGQITREDALKELAKPEYDLRQMQEDKLYVLKKLDFTESEFDLLMKVPPVEHTRYPSYFNSYYLMLKFLGRR